MLELCLNAGTHAQSTWNWISGARIIYYSKLRIVNCDYVFCFFPLASSCTNVPWDECGAGWHADAVAAPSAHCTPSIHTPLRT